MAKLLKQGTPGWGALLLSAVVLSPLAQAEMAPAREVAVQKLAAAPKVDGDASDWSANWVKVPVDSAIDGDDKNRTGQIEVELQYGIAGDQLYMVARWPDSSESRDYKPWVWSKSRKRYARGKERDDMFAQRFDMAGDFVDCMIAKANYDVDVWLWSAGRSDPSGFAVDMWHRISIEPLESSAEYQMDDGTVVYIKKASDDGRPTYKNSRVNRKKFEGDVVPGVDQSDKGRGSVVDVAAKGVWKEGFWVVEMMRPLKTGNPDDVDLSDKDMIRGQIAVFDQGYAEHKSVSGVLELNLAGAR